MTPLRWVGRDNPVIEGCCKDVPFEACFSTVNPSYPWVQYHTGANPMSEGPQGSPEDLPADSIIRGYWGSSGLDRGRRAQAQRSFLKYLSMWDLHHSWFFDTRSLFCFTFLGGILHFWFLRGRVLRGSITKLPASWDFLQYLRSPGHVEKRISLFFLRRVHPSLGAASPWRNHWTFSPPACAEVQLWQDDLPQVCVVVTSELEGGRIWVKKSHPLEWGSYIPVAGNTLFNLFFPGSNRENWMRTEYSVF